MEKTSLSGSTEHRWIKSWHTKICKGLGTNMYCILYAYNIVPHLWSYTLIAIVGKNPISTLLPHYLSHLLFCILSSIAKASSGFSSITHYSLQLTEHPCSCNILSHTPPRTFPTNIASRLEMLAIVDPWTYWDAGKILKDIYMDVLFKRKRTRVVETENVWCLWTKKSARPVVCEEWLWSGEGLWSHAIVGCQKEKKHQAWERKHCVWVWKCVSYWFETLKLSGFIGYRGQRCNQRGELKSLPVQPGEKGRIVSCRDTTLIRILVPYARLDYCIFCTSYYTACRWNVANRYHF